MIVHDIERIIRFGPKIIARGPAGRAIIYLPKEYSWLRGRKAYITIEIISSSE